MKLKSTTNKQPRIHAPEAGSNMYGVFSQKSKKFHLYSVIAAAIVVVMCLAALFLPLNSVKVQLGSDDGSTVLYEKKYSYSTLQAITYKLGGAAEKYELPKSVEEGVEQLKGEHYSSLEKAVNIRGYLSELEQVLTSDCNARASELRDELSEANTPNIGNVGELIDEYKTAYWTGAVNCYTALHRLFEEELENRNADGLKAFLMQGALANFDSAELKKLAPIYLVGEYEIDDAFIKDAIAVGSIAEILPPAAQSKEAVKAGEKFAPFAYYTYDKSSDTYSFYGSLLDDGFTFGAIAGAIMIFFIVYMLVMFIPSVIGLVTGKCKKITKISYRPIAMFPPAVVAFALLVYFGMGKTAGKSYNLQYLWTSGLPIVLIILGVIATAGCVYAVSQANKEFDAIEKEMGEASANTVKGE